MTAPWEMIIFDCDGTLVDSLGGIATCINATLDELEPGRRLSHAEVGHVVGLSLDRVFEELMPDQDLEIQKRGIALYRKHYKERADTGRLNSQLFPGVKEVLSALDSDEMVMAIATGKSLKGLKRSLREFDLEPLFPILQTADDNASKPAPEMVQKALSLGGVRPERTLMVGDTDYDILMGRAAGVKTCAVTYGCHEKSRLEAAKPDYLIDDIRQMLKLPGLERDLGEEGVTAP
ncbi:MAG: HAD-IA family hydrolase [Magnetococcales bacterium]|nr:HAD-IA family hydrolase [Magnetococcales bacterium]